VLDQVDADLNGRTRQSLALICNTLEVKGAPEIEEWKKLSIVWQDQLPYGRIHLFVKLPVTGERKPLLRMEHHLEAFFPLFHCSLMPPSLLFPCQSFSNRELTDMNTMTDNHCYKI